MNQHFKHHSSVEGWSHITNHLLLYYQKFRFTRPRHGLESQADLGSGVFAYFQLNFSAISEKDLEPATSSSDTESEISFKSSSVNFTCNAPMLLSRFLIFVVPDIIRIKKNENYK